MSQRVPGERARWLAAVLMVASIAASSVIVRIWPVEEPSRVLASRHIHPYQAPMAPVPVMAGAAGRPSDRSRQTPRRRLPTEVASLPHAEAVLPRVEPVLAPEAAPPAVLLADVAAVPADMALQVEPPEVRTAVDAAIESPRPVAAGAEGAAPAAVSSRGIVELPAVAVTRAVTIAGRGIMTGLKATGAILRAPF